MTEDQEGHPMRRGVYRGYGGYYQVYKSRGKWKARRAGSEFPQELVTGDGYTQGVPRDKLDSWGLILVTPEHAESAIAQRRMEIAQIKNELGLLRLVK